MKQKLYKFEKDGREYDVIVTFKHQKNIYFRYKENRFHVSSPYLTSFSFIEKGLNKYFYKLIKEKNKEIKHFSFDEDYLYLLGEKHQLSSFDPQIKNEAELNEYLKKISVKTLTNEVRKYEQIMDICVPYNIKIKKTYRQFGSNSKKTHTLSFQLDLIHYSIDIIDTIVVHELAHEFARNHQKEFYDIVYKYCPNYKVLQKKLKRGIHQ